MKRLSGWDAMLIYTETDNIPTHTLKIAVIDVSAYPGQFTFEVFREMLARRLHRLVPLHYRLVEVPLRLHHPVWVERTELDLDVHLTRVRATAPGGRRELDQIIGEIAAKPLDRHRPLWHMHFVEGLAGDRVAVVAKVHHALADGVASANLIARALDPDVIAEDIEAPLPPVPTPTNGELLRAAARDHLDQIRTLPALLKATAAGVSRVRRRANERGPQPGLARNFHAPKTFLNHVISPQRRFASTSIALGDIKATSKRLDVKINDLVLTVVAGALRTLSLRYDGRAEEPMIAHVPSTLNADPNRLTGNELTALNLSLPIHLSDPLDRLRLTALATSLAKEDSELLGPKVEQSWAGYLPPLAQPVFHRMARRGARNTMVNLVVSNVPGPRQRSGLEGALVSEIYSVGPLITGSALNITVWSYVDQLNIAVLTDDVTVRDPHEVTDAIIAALVEIRTAAGLPEDLTPVRSALSYA